MTAQEAALGKAAGIEEPTGCRKYGPFAEESQALQAAWWRRRAELRHANSYERELYRRVKARFAGGLL
jgi:hypothetical protein